MKTGIIVYSITGNTLKVAQRLKKALENKGQEVVLEKITAVNDQPNSKGRLELTNTPIVKDYDNVIMASHVQAFSLCPGMKLYLSQIEGIDGKDVKCLLTQHFPFSWLGGNRAIKQMTDIMQEKGAQIKKSAIVHWSSKQRENEIEKAVKDLAEI